MKSALRVAIVIILFSGTVAFVSAQSNSAPQKQPSSAHRKQSKKTPTPSIETQIQQMREDLQGQIDELKAKLAAKDAQIEALKIQDQNTQQTTAATATRVHDIDNTL